jgi:hypothetical protein
MIDYRSTDGLVVIATHSHGIYSSYIRNIYDVGIRQPAIGADFHFTNYPNPFRESTTLQFSLNARTSISLQVFDALGRPIQTLANGDLPVGEHKYQLAGAGLPAGWYYCTLKAGSFTETKRLIKIE